MLRKNSPGHRHRYGRRAGVAAILISVGLAGSVAANGAAGSSDNTLTPPRLTPLERRAADYISFREDITAIESAPFESADATRNAHNRLAAHDSFALSGGWVAYAALVAADTPAFAKSLQDEVGSKKRKKRGALTGKDAFMAKLAADPSYPRKLNGADQAIHAVLEMTAQDATRFTALGEVFKTRAYAMQKTKWGKQRIAIASQRLSEATQFANSRPAITTSSLTSASRLGVTAPVLASANANWSPNWGEPSDGGRMSEPNAQVIIDRVLNLAARYAVTGVNDKLIEVYAKNDRSERCLSMASLTLSQCIAATRTPYEEAFCLGEHGLNDIGTCVGWVAGAGAD